MEIAKATAVCSYDTLALNLHKDVQGLHICFDVLLILHENRFSS